MQVFVNGSNKEFEKIKGEIVSMCDNELIFIYNQAMQDRENSVMLRPLKVEIRREFIKRGIEF